MRFSLSAGLVALLAADAAVASSWFGKAAYNKWHETELERWLSDHDIPYPAPADRKDLENLVKQNWDAKVVSPYNNWDTNQLQSYLSSKGHDVKKSGEKNKDSLVGQVKAMWTDTADSTSDSYSSVKDWIFDSWTESQLKAFLDYHKIPNPSPRSRDSLLKAARSGYQSAADKVGETAAYPGNWLYQSWSESDLKAWLDERGIPVPQPSSRDKLVASVRRNARLAGKSADSAASSLSASAASAKQSLTDQLLDSWSDSQIKEWADKNGIKVPQGSKRNELIALARKHRAKLSGDNVASSGSSAYNVASSSGSSALGAASSSGSSAYGAASSSGSSAYGAASSSVASAYGAATSSAGNQYAQASQGLIGQASDWFNWAKVHIGMGSDAAKSSLSSASSVASASASSASAAAAGGISSASAVISDSASSASGAASKSGNSIYSNAGKSARAAADAATETLSQGKHRASEAAQKATDRVKEEL
ncbi:hypothetical protein LTR50_002023 [Elasticomyces elasticus]|nr:hypothetical protein LTR50_002023 [Elasticomyces elasticus]